MTEFGFHNKCRDADRLSLPWSERDALIRQLESFKELTQADRKALRELIPRIRQVRPRIDLIREGDVPGDVHLILTGYACRYKILPDGQRHIIAYFVPGDFCNLNVFILNQMDHNIGTISPYQAVEIPRQAIEAITAHHPQVVRALMWCALVDEAVLREWLVNIGSRQADQRIAHLFCELLLRL